MLQKIADPYRSMVETAGMAIVGLDLNRRITEWNPEISRLSGWSREEVITRDFAEIILPDAHRESYTTMIGKVLEGESIRDYEAPIRCSDGTRRLFSWNIDRLRDADDVPIGILACGCDITRREELDDMRRKYEFIANTSKPFMTLISTTYIYEAANTSFCQAHEKDRSEIVGKSVADIWGEKAFIGSIKERLDRCFRGEAIEQFEALVDFPALGSRAFDVGCYPYFDEEGKATHAVIISRDISDRVKIESDLNKARKLESLGILAGGIAHDFNNLLTIIAANVSYAKDSMPPDEATSQALEEAELAAQRANELTQKLLTFAKGGAPVKSTVSITDLLNENLAPLLDDPDIVVNVRIDGTYSVHADDGQLNQVIGDLLDNAVDAISGRGTIDVVCGIMSIGEQSLIPLQKGNYVSLSIKDSGIGIHEENLHKIFDPFYTTKDNSMGLGLASSHSIVRNHDGCIKVISELGVGSTFDVYLPVISRQVQEDKGVINRSPVSGRVLLMDDEELIRRLAARLFKATAYRFAVAKNGNEAIRLFQEAKDLGEPFDVVVLDLIVPGAMGGEETVRQLAEIDPGVKAIVSSGYSDDPVMAEFGKYGFSGVLPKPYKSHDLIAALNKLLTSG